MFNGKQKACVKVLNLKFKNHVFLLNKKYEIMKNLTDLYL